MSVNAFWTARRNDSRSLSCRSFEAQTVLEQDNLSKSCGANVDDLTRGENVIRQQFPFSPTPDPHPLQSLDMVAPKA